ncbi:unnamed protein product [Dovyalis caffra]|uniref:Uncharacterized protein n=1 Tax=Dovyalis caffra TaxID=77055 RepID=A0AAV1SF02_9ROSI|nr:unnamed protein product [Dovyalis caffra]
MAEKKLMQHNIGVKPSPNTISHVMVQRNNLKSIQTKKPSQVAALLFERLGCQGKEMEARGTPTPTHLTTKAEEPEENGWVEDLRKEDFAPKLGTILNLHKTKQKLKD